MISQEPVLFLGSFAPASCLRTMFRVSSTESTPRAQVRMSSNHVMLWAMALSTRWQRRMRCRPPGELREPGTSHSSAIRPSTSEVSRRLRDRALQISPSHADSRPTKRFNARPSMGTELARLVTSSPITLLYDRRRRRRQDPQPGDFRSDFAPTGSGSRDTHGEHWTGRSSAFDATCSSAD